MRYYLDMTADEMTDELDSSVSAIKWSLHAARKRLRGLLQPLRMLTSKTVIESQHNQAEDRE
jgi:DNA-directed RNA polymerase specialized sigma24 family protein